MFGVELLNLVVGFALACSATSTQVVLADDLSASRLVSLATGDIVTFNTSNKKYHDTQCLWAIRCTRNCINIKRKDAHSRGGIPCKVCNGGE